MTELVALESKHLLPPLPYPYAALEPYVDACTMSCVTASTTPGTSSN
jgi:hypothetical protein